MKLGCWLGWLFGGGVGLGGGHLTLQGAEVERQISEGVHYVIYRIDPADLGRLELHWLDEKGQPLENFARLQAMIENRGDHIAFATNAGIYERGPKPSGLTVIDGKVVVPLNLQAGEGNFFLKPNGIFYVDQQGDAGVMESAEYADAGIQARIATQSGPLLLRQGKVHPVFNPVSKNLRQRSGVGVRQRDGQVIFVTTDRDDAERRVVSFHQFASFFKGLGCEDALFLDGDLSEIIVNPGEGTRYRPQTYAAMLVLLKSRAGTPER